MNKKIIILSIIAILFSLSGVLNQFFNKPLNIKTITETTSASVSVAPSIAHLSVSIITEDVAEGIKSADKGHKKTD